MLIVVAVKRATDSWAALGSVGSFGQFLAVLATLGYVAVQVHDGRAEARRARFSERLRALEVVLDTEAGPRLLTAHMSMLSLTWTLGRRTGSYMDVCFEVEKRLSETAFASMAIDGALDSVADLPEGTGFGGTTLDGRLELIKTGADQANRMLRDAASPALHVGDQVRHGVERTPGAFPFDNVNPSAGKAVVQLAQVRKQYDELRDCVRALRRSLPAAP